MTLVNNTKCNAKINDFIHGTWINTYIRKSQIFEDMVVQSFITMRIIRLIALETTAKHIGGRK